MSSYDDLPDHVRRVIQQDGELTFTPPSFERWVGRLQMLRTSFSMGTFIIVWLLAYDSGLGWEVATIRGIVAALAMFFFSWAAGLFVFGELYDVEVKQARRKLEERERDRARRIEEYYRERLRQMGADSDLDPPASAGPPSSAGLGAPPQPAGAGVGLGAEQQRYAA